MIFFVIASFVILCLMTFVSRSSIVNSQRDRIYRHSKMTRYLPCKSTKVTELFSRYDSQTSTRIYWSSREMLSCKTLLMLELYSVIDAMWYYLLSWSFCSSTAFLYLTIAKFMNCWSATVASVTSIRFCFCYVGSVSDRRSKRPYMSRETSTYSMMSWIFPPMSSSLLWL